MFWRFMMTSGHLQFSFKKFSIIEFERFDGTDIKPVSNIIHGPIVVSIKCIVSRDSFLNKIILTLSWLELYRYSY